MNTVKNKNTRQGAVLLVVLFIVMAATVLSLGFLSRSSAELTSGKNMGVRAELDYLAESGLVHAKNLVLNPQEVTGEYWSGAASQQLVAGSHDFYDVSVVKVGEYNYKIISDAYKENAGGSRVNHSSLEAQLRLDPCIAFLGNGDTALSPQVTIIGDVYCKGNLSGSGYIGGDAIAHGVVTTTNVLGQNIQFVPSPVPWPPVQVSNFQWDYYIGSTRYFITELTGSSYKDITWGPSAGNPAGVHYRNGDLTLKGGITINGTLVVNGNLEVTAPGNIITAVKNFPALIVNRSLIVTKSSSISINGLAIIGDSIEFKSGSNVTIDMVGCLCVGSGRIINAVDSTTFVNVTSAPSLASIRFWSSPGNAIDWSPVGRAFFKSIEKR